MKNSILTSFAAVALLLLTVSGSRPAENNVPWKKYTGDSRVDSILNTMTIREMIAQLIWVPAWADERGGNYRQVEELVSKYGVGGVIFLKARATCRLIIQDASVRYPGFRLSLHRMPNGVQG